MISKKVFNQQMIEFQSVLSIETSPEYLFVLYKHIANEFNDDEFILVCHQVMKNEDLYGKMPTVRHFTKYLPKQITVNDEKEAKKQIFLEKVSDYLMCGFITDYERSKFKNLSELESRTLRANGGLSEMWSRVHNLDYPCKVSTIIKELSEFYDNNYTRENVEKRLTISDNRGGGFKTLGQLLTGGTNEKERDGTGSLL